MPELLKIGIKISKSTIQIIVSPLRHLRPPKGHQSWKTFLRNHAAQIWATDFFTVSTDTFKQLYLLVVIALDTREILAWNVTDHPSTDWTYRQILQATWDHNPPSYIICDRDTKFGKEFQQRLQTELAIKVKQTPFRSPQANSFAERLVETLRRECLGHFIPFGQTHLRKILGEFIECYNQFRPHQGIDQQTPLQFGSPPVPPLPSQPIRCKPILNGLHHHYYFREAA
jgi:transposase InsO family protein